MKTIALAILSLSLVLGNVAAKPDKPKTKKKPRMEVCFVLDTTGSMGGLIEGAKQKIWSIANEMISAKPTPEIKLGLIGYRDRGDQYVTQVYDLTDDVDEVYGKLMKFRAQGGGDTPESVNQALHESVEKMSWSKSRKVLKIVFLVGDAPPHMDYQDDVKYPAVCEMAVKNDLIINTIQCGTMKSTTPIWKKIAKLAEGEFVAIQQSGGVVAITTPYDAAIAKCNGRLGSTVCAYGSVLEQRSALRKNSLALSAPSEAAADRASFQSKSKLSGAFSYKVITGDQDLVALFEENKLKWSEVDEKKLPENLKKMSQKERETYLQKQISERRSVQTELDDLLKKRQTFVTAEKKRLAEAGKGDGFDAKV
ncbi:MAG: vWA domain-containing protein, partial [Opitutales bacterium]